MNLISKHIMEASLKFDASGLPGFMNCPFNPRPSKPFFLTVYQGVVTPRVTRPVNLKVKPLDTCNWNIV